MFDMVGIKFGKDNFYLFIKNILFDKIYFKNK